MWLCGTVVAVVVGGGDTAGGGIPTGRKLGGARLGW